MFGRSAAKPIKVEVFAKTDLGRTRDHNEDRFLVADLTRREASLLPAVRAHEVGERGSLFVVADGMGGAAAGELASQMRSEEHTSELQSRLHLVCRLLLEKKKKKKIALAQTASKSKPVMATVRLLTSHA